MMLLLMRHGVAEGHGGGPDRIDAKRPLTVKGRNRVEEVGRLLKGLRLKPRVVLTSPRIRSWETAELVSAQLKASKPVVVDALDFSGSWAGVVDHIRSLDDLGKSDIVLAVGHEPCCSDYLLQAVVPQHVTFPLKKGSVVGLWWPGDIDMQGASFQFYLTARLARRAEK